ncbi:MAG: calcium/sodium antiporter, partial [Bacteroidales bacterium]|nr:calcium/sodium antiporter [Bacteroidales bacterium]
MEYLLLITGFIILFFGGNFLIKGSVSLAFHFKLTKLVVGMTVVAFGTSAPELFVSVVAANQGFPEISVGNVVGSNIANIGLILGLTAIIFPIPVTENAVKKDFTIMLAATLLFYAFILNGTITGLEGVIFIVLLVIYIFISVYYSRKKPAEELVTVKAQFSLPVSIIIIVLSSIALAFGSSLLVNNASVIARNFGIGERVISITLIAVGTSIPELTTSISAALKKELDISFGNIIGSNIFNIFGILGITGI